MVLPRPELISAKQLVSAKGERMNITHQPEEIKLNIPSHPPTEIMRVDLDGGFTVNESIPATDAAREVLRLMKEQWFYDKQATKIRELESELQACKMLITDLEKSRNHFRSMYVDSLALKFDGKPDMRLPWEKTPEAKP